MTSAQKNQLLLEHKFLARVKLWLDERGKGGLTETAGESVVKEIWDHWITVMGHYKDDEAKNSFLDEIDEVIAMLQNFQEEFA